MFDHLMDYCYYLNIEHPFTIPLHEKGLIRPILAQNLILDINFVGN